MPVFILIRLLLFVSLVLFFGWQFFRFFFKEDKLIVLIPFSFLTGFIGYIFLLNFFSYFVPIGMSIYVILLIFLILGVVFKYLNWNNKILNFGISKKWFKILSLCTSLIMISTSLVALRALEYDDLAVGHINLASTISEGNFPVRDILNPSVFSAYHYAPELLTAVIHKISDLPIELGYDFQMFIFSGLLFWSCFIIVYKFSGEAFIGLGASFLLLFGGGLNYFKIFGGLSILYRKFFLQQQIIAPFKFLSQAVDANLVNPTISTIHIHSNALGLPILFLVMYLYFDIINEKEYRQKKILLCGTFLGFTALSVETYYAVFVVALLLFPFFYIRKTSIFQCLMCYSLCIVLISAPIVLLQGGVFTQYINNGLLLHRFSLGVKPTQSILLDEFGGKNFDYVDFFIDLAFPLLLFIPGLIYLRKKRTTMSDNVGKLLLFIVLNIIISLIVPFIIKSDIASELRRFWYFTLMFLSLISGWFLSSYIFEHENRRKGMFVILAIGLYVIIAMAGLIWQITYTFFPIGNIARDRPLIGRVTQMSDFEQQADIWIKTNTTINDRFFVVYNKSMFSFPPTEFAAVHGRFAPVLVYNRNHLPNNAEWHGPVYNNAKSNCSSDSLNRLAINYLYVTPEWPIGLESECLKNNRLNLVFEIKGYNFRRIYKLNN